ncbi:MAG: peptide/nickel transport system substrate-binding protein [Thermomicrobiales bacterium]|jgi:ABC-type transport system substrate-binding protein|nr:peptide/nickel transport system substrate-binding protein [Thermomicrobiales bacterium]
MTHQEDVNGIVRALTGVKSRRELFQQAAALGFTGSALAGVIGGQRAAARPLAQETPKAGGSLTVLTVADPKSLDIHVSQLAQLRQMSDCLWDTLVYMDAADLQIKPRLATEWTWTDDQTLDMTLQAGVTFHEGQPFTAGDVKFTIERILNPQTGSPSASYLAPVETVEVVDDTHVRLRLSRPWPAIIDALSNIYIYSQAATEESIAAKPNGTGPFRFGEWRPNDYLRVEKNASYWIADRPFLDQIDFKPVEEQETRLSMMESQAADVMFSVELKDISRLEGNSSVAVVPSLFNDAGDILYINNNRAPLNNQQLRLAVSHALDRDTYYREFMAGLGARSTSPWVKDHWAYNPINDTAFPYDLEQARALLAAGGYPEGKDANGQQLVINLVFPVGYPEWRQGAIMLQAALGELGVDVKIEELELSTWVDRIVNTDDFDLSWDLHFQRATAPAFTLSYAYFYPPGSENICRYQDEEITRLVAEGGSSFDQEAQREAYWQFQARWNELCPGLIVGERVLAHAAQADVQGFVTHPLFFQDFREVWLNRG